MQDYAKMYRRKFSQRRTQTMLNQIRRIIRSDLSPFIQLVMIMVIVSIANRR